jgi:hypothetical protein
MKIKRFSVIISILLLVSCNNQKTNTKFNDALIPVIEGDWWQLTTTYPEISPYNYTSGDNKVCDFTIFQSTDNIWQIIACVRGNDYPGSQRFLYRWEAENLTDTLWTEKGFFLTTGTPDKPDATGKIWDPSSYPRLGLLQAPHVFIHDNHYYLFYNNENAHAMISDDGNNWEELVNDEGNKEFFEMGRDLMVFKDETDERWITYYTTGGKFPEFIGARTSKTLTGKWSEEKMVYDGWSNTRSPIYRNEFAESPFVVKFDKYYYLFSQLHVFISVDPMDFTANEKIANLESHYYPHRAWAPEIIIHNGQYYISAYRPDGLWMAKLSWVSRQ